MENEWGIEIEGVTQEDFQRYLDGWSNNILCSNIAYWVSVSHWINILFSVRLLEVRIVGYVTRVLNKKNFVNSCTRHGHDYEND